MNFETARNFLAQKGIQATDEQIAQAIAPMKIEDISDNDVDFLAESLAERLALVPIQQGNKGAIAKSNSSGSKVAKGKKNKKNQVQPVNQEEEVEVRTAAKSNLSDSVVQAIADLEKITQSVEQGAELAAFSYGNRIYTALNDMPLDAVNQAASALMATEDRAAFFREAVPSIFADAMAAFEAE